MTLSVLRYDVNCLSDSNKYVQTIFSLKSMIKESLHNSDVKGQTIGSSQ